MLVNITYKGENTTTPLIASLYARFGVITNILYGNVEILQDTPIGNLIVVLSGDPSKRKEAVKYLKANGVVVKEIQHEAAKIISLERKQII